MGKETRDQQFEQALKRCLEALDDLPVDKREHIQQLVEETRLRHENIKSSLQRAIEALDDWRLYRKYQLFDREASHREMQNKNDPESTDQPFDE